MKTKKLVTAAMMTAVMCILAQIAIPLPFAEVPFSLGVLGVFLCGAILEPQYAFLSLLAYDMLGAVGLPVFVGFKGGIGAVVGPTGGFIIAFPIMALVIALTVKLMKSRKFYVLLIGMTAAVLILHILGTAWYSTYASKDFFVAASIISVPFIPFDYSKAIFASLIVSQLMPRLQKQQSSSEAA